MDPDIVRSAPGKCPRCGMTLVQRPVQRTTVERPYPVRLSVAPADPRPGAPIDLSFTITDPRTGAPVRDFETVHERLFHLFVVSRDLTFFAHEHPALQRDGTFALRTVLPRTGEYRLLSDFYPRGGTPQLVESSVALQGPSETPHLAIDVTPKRGPTLEVALRTLPAQPRAGERTVLFFDLQPWSRLERYLGTWGHLLAASEDLRQMIHAHPAFDDPGRTIQFNVEFRYPGLYRIWVQFQCERTVNTAPFTIRVVPA